MNFLKGLAKGMLKNGGIKGALKAAANAVIKKYLYIGLGIAALILILIISVYMLLSSFLCKDIVQLFADEEKTGIPCPKPPIDLDKLSDLAGDTMAGRMLAYVKIDKETRSENELFRTKEQAQAQNDSDKEVYSEAEYMIRTMAEIDLNVYVQYVETNQLRKGGTLYDSPIDYSVTYSKREFKKDWTNWFKSEETKNKKFNKDRTHYLMNYRLKVYRCYLLGEDCSDEVLRAMGTDKYTSVAISLEKDKKHFTRAQIQEILDDFYHISFIKYLDGKVDGVPKGKSKEMYEELLAKKQAAYNDLYPASVPDATAAASDGWLIPMIEGTYNYASPFGMRTYNGETKMHNGVDLGTMKVAAVPYFAAKSGTVVSAGWNNGGYGGVVTIKSDDGYYFTYNHMYKENIVVKKGQKVTQGQLVGAAGNQPDVAYHLHFEVCKSITKGTGYDLSGGDLMICNERINPESDEVFGNSLKSAKQDITKTNKYAKQFLSDWKAKALKGKAIIMPGFSPSTGLGKLSEEYEGKPGVCNKAYENSSNFACGAWQLTDTTIGEFMKYLQKHKPEYYQRFKGLNYLSYNSSFANAWAKLYKDDPNGFYQAQHGFIQESHYDPVVKALKSKYGYDVKTKPVAIQEMIWSSAVQHRAWTYSRIWPYIGTSWKGKSDAEVIKAFYAARKAEFGACCTPRFVSEEKAALKMLGSGK